MAKQKSGMRIRLSDERRAALIEAITHYFEQEFDEPLSQYRAEALLDFFMKSLGPPIYNQGVRDAISAVQQKLGDLEGEVYEAESGNLAESRKP